MPHLKQFCVFLAFIAFIVLGVAATMPPEGKVKRNLKVLPKNISKESLDSIMKQIRTSLGVKCTYCHVADKDDPKKMNFSSDEKPEKEMARDMMRMTGKINKKYFKFLNEGEHKADTLRAVTCKTCHRGKAKPDAL